MNDTITSPTPTFVRRSGGFYSPPLLALRGLAAFAFVLAALLDFEETIHLLVWFFSIYVFFDGAYALAVAAGHSPGSTLNRIAIACKGVIGILAGIVAISLFLQGGSMTTILLTVFIWVALAGVIEGVWVFKMVKNKEILLIVGSGAYLALAVALQFMFAVAPSAGTAVYNWIIIGFSAAFGLGMLIMSWLLRRSMVA